MARFSATSIFFLAALLLVAVVHGAEQVVDAGAGSIAEEGAPAPESAAIAGDVNRMRKPEISAATLTGLMVGAAFLTIFIPGFLCLWNIQPPHTFATVEGSDPRKKLQ